ncbi:Guanylate kinase/L-type calcium channel beta subunit [Syntrophomonas zehnderi OL-4]|uniref:Guanylate kinase n=1 Tax=Syntrophomonas zehnderi OL-4 TaxID=690567 RepID=A0A0E3W3E8_9FIRM|nr:guanylate kinase [Syntrophomonas zehnderi]CFX76941.1 Guanylate kinase/L-type calcium channel beta subunit [Syntrophomonas zehnderi OL-4]
MSRKGILFVISGPSGVGKGTIKDLLLSRLTDVRLSISATTRPPREGEVAGRDYFFLDSQEFSAMINRGEFLEYAQVYTNMYGTPKRYVQDKLSQGYDVLLEIDIQGAMQVKTKMPQGVFIFIEPPSIDELAFRLSSRGKDSQESIAARLAASHAEMESLKYYDYVVVNDNLEDAVNKVHSIIIAERCRVKNNC